MPHIRTALALVTALFAGPAMAQAETGATASATMMGPDGAEHGTVTFTETNSGVIIKAELTGLPPGPHGFHLHAVGAVRSRPSNPPATTTIPPMSTTVSWLTTARMSATCRTSMRRIPATSPSRF